MRMYTALLSLSVAKMLTRSILCLAVWTKCWRWWFGSDRPTWWSSREWAEPFTPTTTPCSAARASRWPSSRTRGWQTDWEESCLAWSSSTRCRLENPFRALRRGRPREPGGARVWAGHNVEVERPGRISWSSECKDGDCILPLSERLITKLTVKLRQVFFFFLRWSLTERCFNFDTLLILVLVSWTWFTTLSCRSVLTILFSDLVCFHHHRLLISSGVCFHGCVQ